MRPLAAEGAGSRVGYGRTRKGFVVVSALGYSRFGAGTVIFLKEAPDILCRG